MRACLVQTKDYPGVSGPISIMNYGDGMRRYVLKQVQADGTLRVIGP